jgi:hypothetical protein
VDDCKNLSDHEALIRLISATAQNLFVEFTENKLLYPLSQAVATMSLTLKPLAAILALTAATS